MLIITLWLYIFFILVIFLCFILLKIKSDNFITINKNITIVNKVFFAILLFLTILWIVLIFSVDFRKEIKINENNIENVIHY